MGLGASGLSPRGLGLCSPIGCSGFPTRRSLRLGAGGGFVAGLRVGRSVGVPSLWGVIAVALHEQNEYMYEIFINTKLPFLETYFP